VGEASNDLHMTQLTELLRVGPGPVDLAAIDPRGTPGLPDGREHPKRWARDALRDLTPTLADLQQRLYAQALGGDSRRRLLLVLQAMDCGGKDGTIKSVAGAMNPLGMCIVAFGPPTREELAHHFLWRIRRALPPPGYVGIFHRSHYEDVLVARVRGLVPERTWRGRYDQINRFERSLLDDGITLVKVMLHISYDEQEQRLLDRLDDPTKHWKYNSADVEERGRWADYQAAYGDALARCSTEHAPWYVVPADRKWYRNWAVANLLIEVLGGLGLEYPPPTFDVAAERKRVLAT
jgi:PPK2 family polyphosphate:nucleotide phosphotransferase